MQCTCGGLQCNPAIPLKGVKDHLVYLITQAKATYVSLWWGGLLPKPEATLKHAGHIWHADHMYVRVSMLLFIVVNDMWPSFTEVTAAHTYYSSSSPSAGDILCGLFLLLTTAYCLPHVHNTDDLFTSWMVLKVSKHTLGVVGTSDWAGHFGMHCS